MLELLGLESAGSYNAGWVGQVSLEREKRLRTPREMGFPGGGVGTYAWAWTISVCSMAV